jgi:photosystem II stability/assembly factor-like uncharacterized protein
VKHTAVSSTFTGAVAAAAALLSGCQGDTGSARSADSEAAVRRYDIVQALAAQARTVVAGTQTGALLASSDGGATWVRHDLGPHSFVAIAACPDGTFVAADFYHHVLKIEADGTPGKPLALENPATPLTVACDAQGRWWVAGTFATLAMSADQGATWTVQDFGEDAHLTAVQFIDATHAIVAGEFGLLFSSADGGATWTRGPAVPNEFYPYAAHFDTADEGWIAGIAGQVLKTSDAGASWVREPNAAGFALYRLFAANGRLYGVGAGGVAARGADGTWQALPGDAPPAFAGAATPVIDDATAVVVIGGVGTPQLVSLPAG